MPRPKRYATDAEKMKAYRERKKSPENLPVPVLAEPNERTSASDVLPSCGEARESNEQVLEPTRSQPNKSDSRGGQTLSKSDQLKDQDRPSWYIFGDTEREKNCWLCGKKFSTRLEMGKFCSPKCKNEFLDSAFTTIRKPQ